MAVIVPDQGTVQLGNSRINPADTYVRTTPQDVSSGFESLSRALGIFANAQDADAARQKNEQERLDAEKVPYYVSQFSQELDSGVVDEVQVGKRLPQSSKLIVAKVTEGIGARQWEDYSRNYMEEALRNDESIRTDPVKRKSFFDQLRKDMAEKTRGRDFYGAGAARAVEGVINEFEGNFQREGAADFQKQQEADLKQDVYNAYRYKPASTENGALLDFISKPESGGNYNAYYGNTSNSSVRFTDMTIEQVMQWQRNYHAKGSPSTAVGKYQFIQDTLRETVKSLGIDPATTKFTPEVQDQLAEQLLKKRGLDDYRSGKITKEQFANNLALEWAGLPAVSGPKAGRSQYDGDGLNKSGVKVNDLLAALDVTGASTNQLSAIESVVKRTTGISPVRSREIIVESFIDLAMETGDTTILDRLEQDAVNPTNGQSYLLPEHKAKIEKVRNDVVDLNWRRFKQNEEVKELARQAEDRQWRNDMTTRYVKGQPIDLVKDARNPDGSIDTVKKKFLEELETSARVSSVDSTEAAANFEDALLSASTFGGSYQQLFKNDIILGPLVQEGKTPTPDQIRDHIVRRTDINPADKEKLVAKVDTLMEGVSLLRDPDITTAFKEGVGMDVDAFIKNPKSTSIVINNPNIASAVQSAYMTEIKLQVKADIEDGLGVPKGRRKYEIIEAAQAKAEKKLASFAKDANNKTTTNNTQPKAPAPKGRWEVIDGIKRWIPE